MRLIDADSLLQVIRKNIPQNPHDEYQEGQEIGLSMAVEMVCNEPTVDIVRCKDCKYCDRHHLVDGLFCYRLYEKYNKEYPQMIIEVDADDFCSRGERK